MRSTVVASRAGRPVLRFEARRLFGSELVDRTLPLPPEHVAFLVHLRERLDPATAVVS